MLSGNLTGNPALMGADGPSAWSGVVIDADRGQILTIDRTNQSATPLVITFADGSERLTAEIRRDPYTELALLVVDARGLQIEQARWGEPDKLEPGDWLIALGRPVEGAPTMSAGIFSARRRVGVEELIETDAVIPRVGAGGVLVNLDGEVIGIGRPGGRRGDGNEGMSHAIPADRARRVAADLARFGLVRRGYLGMQVDPLGPPRAGRRASPAGVRVAAVGAGSPAAEAGIRPGDVIITASRRPIESLATLQQVLELAPIGEPMTLTIERGGRSLDVTVRPRAMPMPGMPAGPDTGRDAVPGRPTAPAAVPARPARPERPATPNRDATPEELPRPDPIPPRPEGAESPPLLSPGTPSSPPGR